MRHAGADLLFGKTLGQRDLDRAIEWQLSTVDAMKRVDGGTERVIRLKQGPTKLLACNFDFLGKRDFFFA